MPTYDYLCDNCKHVSVEHRKYEERDEPLPCPECGKEANRAFLNIGIRTAKLSKTFISGTRPKSEGFDTFKKVAKLEQAHADSGNKEEKKQIRKEITERKKVK
jgi:putative FmdB family regulatory protein